MNRTLLIIVCDFLLISLLSMARFDQNDPNPRSYLDEETQIQKTEDVLEALTLAIETEQAEQVILEKELDNVKGDLSATRSILETKKQSLKTTESHLAEAEKKVRELQTIGKQLEKDLTATSQKAAVSKAKFETIVSELTHRRKETSQMQERLDVLKSKNFNLALDLKESQTKEIVVREQLAATRDDLKVAQSDVAFSRSEILHARSEVKHARTETERARDEKKAIRQHADRLASGVHSLAERSEKIREEIKSNTPLSANRIFDEFRNNQIHTHFHASRRGLFGRQIDREKETKSILASDGIRFYILYHIEETPLSLLNPDAQWERLTGVVKRQNISYSIPVLSGLAMDPRILVVPVGRAQAEHLDCKIYPFADDPYKFQEAVLIGSEDAYFGEVAFQLDPKHPDYVKMDRPSFGKLFGKFSPSRGDLVFSKTGELLGIMSNTKYCAVFRNIEMKQKIRFGMQVDEDETAAVLDEMRDQFQTLPFALQ